MSGQQDRRHQQGPQWNPPQWDPEARDRSRQQQAPTHPGQQYAPGWTPPAPQQQYAPYRAPRRKGRGWLTGCLAAVGAAVVVIIVVIVVALALASGGGPKSSSPAAASGSTITYIVTGSAADVTYGPSGSDASGSVPMRKTATIPADPPVDYSIEAQLQGSGSVTCEILVGGKVVSKSAASGSYNIASCEILQDPFSGKWQDANSA